MNRLGLKISCILVSVLIWIQVASTADIEQVTHMPLVVTGLGEGLTVSGSEYLPLEVRVRVTGSKLRLLTHQYFNGDIGEVRVNLSGLADTTFSYQLAREDIFTDMSNPDIYRSRTLTLTIDREISRMVPVALATEGALPRGVDFVIAPRVTPDSVRVTGPSRYFSEDLTLETTSVKLDRLSGTSEQTLDLLSVGEFLEVGESKVKAAFLLGKLEERTLANIPVIPLVDAGRPDVGISPPVADVMVRGIADSMITLTRNRISVVVPVDNLSEGMFVLDGQVVHPDWLHLIRLDPPQFQVIVGNPPLRRNDAPEPTDGGDPE